MPRFIAAILVLYVVGSPAISDALPGDFGKAMRSFHDASNDLFSDPRGTLVQLIPERPKGLKVDTVLDRRERPVQRGG